MRAEEAHVPDIVRLVGELRAQEELPPGISVTSVRAYLTEPQTEVFVAMAEEGTDRGGVVGLLTVRILGDLFHDGTSAMIQELIVDGQWRGQGVGGALLDAAVNLARERGCAEIGVSTGIQNPDAQALYRSRGFGADSLLFERHF
jgi:ribosomal protein S18 acetylase RimI-like enzyme